MFLFDKKIVILSTDTIHHRYFNNWLQMQGCYLTACIYETTYVEPEFKTAPLFENKQDDFERKNFLDADSLIDVCPFEAKDINDNDSYALIKDLAPDFGVVFGTRRITQQIIDLFPDGLINVHRGIAQEYRGLDSDLWAIYHDDYHNIGVTIHKVDRELDTGGIAYQEKMPLIQGMQIHQIRYYTTVMAGRLVVMALQDYAKNQLKFDKQEKLGRYYSFMPLALKIIVEKKFNNYCKNLKK